MNPSIPLSKLPRGQRARILLIAGSEALSRKLLEMGFEAGQEVMFLHKGLLGDPLAIRMNDRIIALRKRDASHISVEIL